MDVSDRRARRGCLTGSPTCSTTDPNGARPAAYGSESRQPGEENPVAELLARGGTSALSSQLVGAMAYWIVMLVVLVAALNALQLTATAELLQRLVGCLPTIVTAIVVLTLGILATGLLAATVRTIASNAGIAQAPVLGQFAPAIVIIFSMVVALQQIQFVGDAWSPQLWFGPRIRAWMQGFGGTSDERFGRSPLATSGVDRESFWRVGPTGIQAHRQEREAGFQNRRRRLGRERPDVPPFESVFPLSRHGPAGSSKTAGNADRAVLYDFR